MLLADDTMATCTFMSCDPYTTESVHGVSGQGDLENCGRVNKEGVNFLKADRSAYERQLALYYTPQEYGGCKDCRFFIMCKGQCPGTGIDQDWRNRTMHCESYFKMFEKYEKKFMENGVLPLSQHPALKEIEEIFLKLWELGEHTNIQEIALPIISNHVTFNEMYQRIKGGKFKYKHADQNIQHELCRF